MRIKCACKKECGDIPEEEDHKLAVCKGLKPEPKQPLVILILEPRSK